MTTDQRDHDAEVIELHPQTEATEVVGEPVADAGPLVLEEPGTRRQIIPENWRRDRIRATVEHHAGLHWHRAKFHGVRAPMYALKTVFYAFAGVMVLTGTLMRWWHWTDGWVLESQAVAKGNAGHGEAMAAHKQGIKTRGTRGRIVFVCGVLALLLLIAMVAFLPGWAQLAVATVVFGVLVYYGKPDGKSLATAAVVPPKYMEPTPEVITRAMASLRIQEINALVRDGERLAFVTDVHRDGPGWGVEIDLPHGVTAKSIVAKRSELASGLRRPLSATWPKGVPGEHEGRLSLWIGFQDLAKMKAPAWPLLKAGQADVFAGLPFGTDPRGQRVDAGLFEVNWLVGAAPGQGKTAAIRVLACAAALDPLAEIWIHEHAGKGDLEPLAQVCHRYVSGLDDESIAYAAESLRMLRKELDRRSVQFKKIPRVDKPDGKVTRDMAAKRSQHLYPIVAFFDEVQNVFMHPEFGENAKADAAYILRVGRAYGLILVLGTQRPAADAVPTSVSGIVTNRFCLKVPDQPSNDLVLGTSSYRAGYDATVFRAKTDAGMGWLKAEGDPQIVKTYYLDLNATEKVAKRARGIREAAGTLTGYALGEAGETPERNFLLDVLNVFGADDKLWSETVAARLAERIPEAYDAVTRDSVASQLRKAGVAVKDVRETGKAQRKGCERADVESVAGVAATGGRL
jgi:S-DNA-T family DNA segregation ATPase FtsK/SpoIIIE